MKTVILLFMVVLLSANEVELFEKLFSEMFNKKEIKVYTKYKNFNSKILKKVTSCKEADIVLGELNCSKPKFVLSYADFKNDSKVIGAFYWRKGRPQLRLRKNNILNHHLYLSKDFSEYLE